MNEFLQLFGDLSLSTVFTFFIAMVFIVKLGTKIYKWIVQNHDKKQEKDELLKQISEDLKILKENQSDIEDKIKELKEAQNIIMEKQDEYEERNKTHNLNKLRDRLLQSYRFYTDKSRNPLMIWSEMEKEVFDKLFKDYEILGGNGFMHSTVQPAMESLGVIKMDETEKLIEMMKSRQANQ